ncbi:GNAT family N-acetyltransferase [Nocardioides sp. S-58]|uniref:GNAT family N-acetyltransferase n=1 Tax=Nocardioides renjunii TaxID=3095075 RepID=A0ABU5KCG8_9ACTN|nr:MULTISPECIES: GNAT family N-acetyltransferase [unclassified Nocardioides]MDZ5662673.1 GNAT family N-acetyltransferase [Nocardioides sp. S-58]WQQ23538.1 GNAT family N-acetyltransferase [Nocardioides sp. S-34]
MSVEVVDVPERQRFEALVDGTLVGFAAYQTTSEMVVFTHTEVDSSVEGQGVGGALVRGALDQVRGAGLRVLPICPFVQAWIGRHPDYADLDYRRPPSKVTD